MENIEFSIIDPHLFVKKHNKLVNLCYTYDLLTDRIIDTQAYSGARMLALIQSGGVPYIDLNASPFDELAEPIEDTPVYDGDTFDPVGQMLDRNPYIELMIKSQRNYYIRLMSKIIYNAYKTAIDYSRSINVSEQNLMPSIPLNPSIRNLVQKVHLRLRDGAHQNKYQSLVKQHSLNDDLISALEQLQTQLQASCFASPETLPNSFDNQNYTPLLNFMNDLFQDKFYMSSQETKLLYKCVLGLLQLSINQTQDPQLNTDTISDELQQIHISDSTLAILPDPTVTRCKGYSDDGVSEVSNRGLLYIDAYSRYNS